MLIVILKTSLSELSQNNLYLSKRCQNLSDWTVQNDPEGTVNSSLMVVAIEPNLVLVDQSEQNGGA